MAGYREQDKIAEMAGIPSAISKEINRFMDDMNPPEEFEDHNTERKIFATICILLSMIFVRIRIR